VHKTGFLTKFCDQNKNYFRTLEQFKNLLYCWQIQEDKNQDFTKVCKTKTSKTPENKQKYYGRRLKLQHWLQMFVIFTPK
jgi:hypoxanthine phosphoribosyltransferase